MLFLVEDDDSIRNLVVYTLKQTGFSAKGFPDAASFRTALLSAASSDAQDKPQLVLLDIMLPGEDGLSLLRFLRADVRFRTLPVMMLTAKGTEYDKVLGLDLGADDYLAKPFGMMELVARVKALLRRADTASTEAAVDSLQVGQLLLNPVKHLVTANGKPVQLTFKEFELLHCLLRHRGQVLTRELLLSGIWGYDFDGETRTVDVHIRSLRQKLGDCGALIKTIRSVGYTIDAP